jgi:hypothetical protein
VTQPEPPPDHTAEILATVAATYALVAIEARVREEIEDSIAIAATALIAIVVAAIATPGVLIASGLQLIARHDVNTAIGRLSDKTRDHVAASVHSGYAAAAQIALQKATRDLAEYDYTAPNTLPELGDNIDRLLDDIDTMFGHAHTDFQNSITTAYDSKTDLIARAAAIRETIDQAAARLNQRALATATTAVHTGAFDAQQAIYNEFQTHTGRTGLLKRWRVTSRTPCGMCDALDGTTVGINAEFDHDATTDDRDTRPVWRNLQGPPRHPNCRCHIELVQV